VKRKNENKRDKERRKKIAKEKSLDTRKIKQVIIEK